MAWTIQQRRTIRSAPRRKPDVWALPFANETRNPDVPTDLEPDGDPQPWTDQDLAAPPAAKPRITLRQSPRTNRS